MSFFNKKSLKWQLISKVTIVQSLILILILAFHFFMFGLLWYLGYINKGNSYIASAQIISDALRVNKDGNIYLSESADLKKLRAENNDFWFVIKTQNKKSLTEGHPPATISSVLPALDAISYADLGQDADKSAPPLGTVQWQKSQVGLIKIATNAKFKVSVLDILNTAQAMLIMLIYLVFVVTLASFVVIPFVIRHSFKELDKVTEETKDIDINHTGKRLKTDKVPLEVIPLVNAVNATLNRLDKGYEVHKRFLTDAAHELRTPISILTTRLSALPSGKLKNRLLEDSARLTVLADQLLDLQRFNQEKITLYPVELVGLAEQIISDLAPLIFNAGYELTFENEAEQVFVNADQMSIERALTNLIQNAVNYGGRQGTISVYVSKNKWIDVSDEGKGIPLSEVENIFEPFHRLAQDGRGVGLGLDLVKKIMHMHGGNVEVVEKRGKGACFRLSFP